MLHDGVLVCHDAARFLLLSQVSVRRRVRVSLASRIMLHAARDSSFDQGWVFHRGLCPITMSDHDPCAAPEFDSRGWRPVELPHDWSREDLPPRHKDKEFPVLAVRYGPWKLSAGDDASWASAEFDDSAWSSASGGADWRLVSSAFEAENATGWYRQHVTVPTLMVNCSAKVTLSLGIIAGADTTYVNGLLIGRTPQQGALSANDYVTHRAYTIPRGLLRDASPNVVAVRVVSKGGRGHGAFNGSTSPNAYPGGMYNDPNLKHHDARIGPFDAAVSPGQVL